MRLLRRHSLLCSALFVVACERGKPAEHTDTAVSGPAAASESTTTPPPRTWNPSAGPLLLVAAETPSRAFVIVPDSANASAQVASIPHPAAVTLLGRGGTVQTAELPLVSDTSSCLVATLNAAPPPRPWNIGFIGGVVSPLPMDSVETLSASDSALMAAAVIRIASALPNDSAGRFSGLPFVVRTLWRFTIPSGAQVVVATLVRQINQEATPLQEHTFLIAERQTTGADATLSKAYVERSRGAEETIESSDVLAAVLLGGNRSPAIIVSRDYGDATAYGLLQRGDDGHWRAQWASERRHC
jgi:hypothetical protein